MFRAKGIVSGDALDAVRDPCDADRYPLLEVVQDGAFCDRLAPEHAGHALMRMLPGEATHVWRSGRATFKLLLHSASFSCEYSHGLAANPPTKNTV